MKKFLSRVTLFFMIIAALLICGEYVVRRIPNAYATKREAIAKYGHGTETVVLGSSHTYYGVVADSMPNTLNLANISQAFEYDYRVLDRYIDSLPSLRRVIIPVSYFSFFDAPFETTDNRNLETYYRLYLDIDKYHRLSRADFEICSFPSYSGKLKSFLMHKQGPQTSSKGFGLDYLGRQNEEHIKSTAQTAAERHSNMANGNEAYQRLWFEKLIEMCIDRGVQPLLITTPVTRYYAKLLDNKQVERTRYLVQLYRQKYSLPYYDFSEAEGFTYDDFHDADHLNRDGAIKFTRLLNSALDNQTDNCRH